MRRLLCYHQSNITRDTAPHTKRTLMNGTSKLVMSGFLKSKEKYCFINSFKSFFLYKQELSCIFPKTIFYS